MWSQIAVVSQSMYLVLVSLRKQNANTEQATYSIGKRFRFDKIIVFVHQDFGESLRACHDKALRIK